MAIERSTQNHSGQTVPLVEEFAEVEKVMVDRGGFRISKNVEVEAHTLDEPLQHFRCEVERRAINKQLDGTTVPNVRYEGETLVVPVIEEVLVTEKRLVLVEEVRITRIAGTHSSPKTVELRRENVVVQRLEPEISPKPNSS